MIRRAVRWMLVAIGVAIVSWDLAVDAIDRRERRARARGVPFDPSDVCDQAESERRIRWARAELARRFGPL